MTENVVNDSIIDTVLGQWRRRKWLLIVSFVAVFSLVFSLVMALPSLYQSSTTLLFGEEDITESLVKTNVDNETELRLGIIQQAVLSRNHLQEVIDKFGLYGPLKANQPPESVIERFRRDIHIDKRASAQPEWGKRTSFVVTISYQGWDADLVAKVANDLAARFKAENERIRTQRAERTTEFIGQELEEAKQEFFVQESRLNAFRNEHMGELPEQQQTNLVTLERLNAELRLNEEKQMRLLARRDAALFGITSGDRTAPVAGLSGALRLERLERELADMQSRYTENYPGIIHLKSEINTLKREVETKGGAVDGSANARLSRLDPAEMDMTQAGLKAEETRLHEAIAALMRRIEGTPKIDQQLKQFAYDYDSTKDKYLSLKRKYQDAQLAQSFETQQSQQFKIIEVAIPSAFPAAPNRSRMIFIGFMLSAGIAGFALFLAERLDQSFHAVADLRRFTNIPVLASITTIQTLGDQVRIIGRFGLVSAAVIAGLVLITGFGYYAGANAEQFVLAMSA